MHRYRDFGDVRDPVERMQRREGLHAFGNIERGLAIRAAQRTVFDDQPAAPYCRRESPGQQPAKTGDRLDGDDQPGAAQQPMRVQAGIGADVQRHGSGRTQDRQKRQFRVGVEGGEAVAQIEKHPVQGRTARGQEGLQGDIQKDSGG